MSARVSTQQYPPNPVGTLVRTTTANTSLRYQWSARTWMRRKWGREGKVVDYSNQHSLRYRVRHICGTEGWYDPSELAALEAV